MNADAEPVRPVSDMPPPVVEEPPLDRYCDLVLTGGVASGVVYPWAVVELARSYRFKSIGGTSVGAMAAALTAAAEYGRRNGFAGSFDVLRNLPVFLAKDVGGGRARMQALFQPEPRCERLFSIFLAFIGIQYLRRSARWRDWLRLLACVLWQYRKEALAAALWALLLAHVAALMVLTVAHSPERTKWVAPVFVGLLAVPFGVLFGVASDIGLGLIPNGFGLVTGGRRAGQTDKTEDDDPGLTAWLHKGIQISAGLHRSSQDRHAAPLTFRDLWRAPAFPGAEAACGSQCDAPGKRSIDLQVVTTNVTHGRPYLLPLQDESSQLYYNEDELKPYFPAVVMKALRDASVAYCPRSGSDPADDGGRKLRELPSADLPIIVAARLSLSFPLLFATVPLWAVDYESPRDKEDQPPKKLRRLKRCRFSDGGICSNFPIHLFDSAVPPWPTFGIWLDKRHPNRPDDPVWLPEHHLSGRGDNWQRFEQDDPTAGAFGRKRPGRWGSLIGFLVAAVLSAKDWSDRTMMRMPNARNRVLRVNLLPHEGELNIAMSGETILQMARDYGTAAGKLLVKRFAAAPKQPPTQAWREHQWVRLHILLEALRELLRDTAVDSRNQAHSLPLRELIRQCTKPGTDGRPAALRPTNEDDKFGKFVDTAQARALVEMLDAVEALEQTLVRNAGVELPYRPMPQPALRIRPPV